MSDKVLIRLKPGVKPITVSGYAQVALRKEPLAFPTLARQENGWRSKDYKEILREFGYLYEKVEDKETNGGN